MSKFKNKRLGFTMERMQKFVKDNCPNWVHALIRLFLEYRTNPFPTAILSTVGKTVPIIRMQNKNRSSWHPLDNLINLNTPCVFSTFA